jgi:hypothetical protein
VIIVVIGGMGSITGIVMGATILVVMPELFREFSDYRMIAYALALILVMILRPQGIMGVQELWEVPWTRRAWWKQGLTNLRTRRNTLAIAAFAAAVVGLADRPAGQRHRRARVVDLRAAVRARPRRFGCRPGDRGVHHRDRRRADRPGLAQARLLQRVPR